MIDDPELSSEPEISSDSDTVVNIYLHPVQYLFITCSMLVQCLFSICSILVQCLFIACSMLVQCLFSTCSMLVQHLFNTCSAPVLHAFDVCGTGAESLTPFLLFFRPVVLSFLQSGDSHRHLRGRTALQADLSLPPTIPGRCPGLLTV